MSVSGRPLRPSVRRVLGRSLLSWVTVGAGLVAAASLSGASVTVAPAGRGTGATEADRVQLLMSTHDCWSGEAPADVEMPSSAVVTRPGGVTRIVPAEVGFGIWLDVDPGVLHGFYRWPSDRLSG